MDTKFAGDLEIGDIILLNEEEAVITNIKHKFNMVVIVAETDDGRKFRDALEESDEIWAVSTNFPD